MWDIELPGRERTAAWVSESQFEGKLARERGVTIQDTIIGDAQREPVGQ